jgi:hypothetical protein
MRLTALLIASSATALIAGAPVYAQTAQAGATPGPAQDRYDAPIPRPQASPGPSPSAGVASSALRGPQGAAPIRTSYLTWTGKVDPLRGAQSDGDRLRGPALLDTATGRALRADAPMRGLQAPVAQSVAAPIPAPAPVAALRPSVGVGAAPTPPQPKPTSYASAASAPAAAAPPRRLPASLYDQGYAGPAAATPAQQTQPVQTGQPAPLPPLAGAAPAPQAQSQAQAPAQGQLAAAESGPRYYSLHREYGLTPDPIPPAAPSVLSLSPTVAQAMAGDKDDGPPIDLAGQDQADAAPPPHNYNYNTGSSSSGSGTTSTNANGQTTTTYTIR